MKKTVLSITLAASMAVLAACSGDANDASNVVAETSIGNVTEQDLYNEMKDAVGPQALQQIILGKVLQEKFEVKEDEVKDAVAAQKEMFGDQFEALLAQEGLTEESFEKNVRYSLLQQKLMDSVELTDEELDAAVERANKEMHAKHILVDTEDEAKQLIAQLDDGADFSELAKEHSTEPRADETGGDLGWFPSGMMAPPFEIAASELEKGKYTKEPVETKFGYHVIQLIDIRDAEEQTPEDEARQAAESLLTQYKADELLTSLIQEANVNITAEEFKGHVFKDILK